MAAVEGQNRRSWHWQIFKLRFCGAVLDATVNWSLQQSKLSAEIVLLFFYFLLTFNLLYSVFLVLSKNGNMHSFNTLPSGGAFISHPRVSSAVVLCEVVVATL